MIEGVQTRQPNAIVGGLRETEEHAYGIVLSFISLFLECLKLNDKRSRNKDYILKNIKTIIQCCEKRKK